MGFIGHQNITLCSPEPASVARSVGFSCLHVIYSALPVGTSEASCVYSVGRIGLPNSVKRPHKILSKTGQKHLSIIASAE